MKQKNLLAMPARLLLTLLIGLMSVSSFARETENFNSGWLMRVGDISGAERADYDDRYWQAVTLPRAINEDEAYSIDIHEHTDTVAWYRKHFTIGKLGSDRLYLELEGARFAADVYVNGTLVGTTENGVMASGYDLTPHVRKGKNVIAIRTDNDWRYHERSTGSTWQWNDKNFNANYGGLTKNLFLHRVPATHQTLPLLSSLGTTGIYIYATDIDTQERTLTINAESQVLNTESNACELTLCVSVQDIDGKEVARFEGKPTTLTSGSKQILTARGKLSNANLWSWGYGYLYTVRTSLRDSKGKEIDPVMTRTGFRKTRYAEGKIWLNDRVMMVHGYAQRTSNEWPALGMSVPAWMSDLSNSMIVESGGNIVRWMHVCPWKQDIESCDRVGLPQAMPAGDAERDVTGRRWEQRVELMRDAIVYNRNNPSILFYECGNAKISREHMEEMRALRDQYDPHGGRAMGCREMLDVDVAEYGGEMLYVNKSTKKPMWMMEYCRDEGLRRYWDAWTWPYHAEGDGPLYRNKPANDYNHNMDEFAKKMVTAWYDYYLERPGTGKRVNSGGVKIVFSDTNTHYRGESNYRTSGVVDAMRIPKDAFWAHKVMWDGWVTPERDATHIVGHWNYERTVTDKGEAPVKPIYVVSTADEVELTLNGESLGKCNRSHQYLFTLDNVTWKPGSLIAIGRRDGKVVTSDTLTTSGPAHSIRLRPIVNPLGFTADGADIAIVEVEVVDAEGRRCPTYFGTIDFEMSGAGEWRGGIGSRSKERKDNYILSKSIPMDCGIGRVMIRSTTKPGKITLTAKTKDAGEATLTLSTQRPTETTLMPNRNLACRLDRGPTPSTPSYADEFETVEIASATAGSNQDDASKCFDDTENSEWSSDGNRDNSWIRLDLKGSDRVDEIAIKLTGWRNRIYPLAVYAGEEKVWEGVTYPTLGYVHIRPETPKEASSLTIKMLGPSENVEERQDTQELAGGQANQLDRMATRQGEVRLRIVEVDLLRRVK